MQGYVGIDTTLLPVPDKMPLLLQVQVHCLTGHDDTVCSILSQGTDPQVFYWLSPQLETPVSFLMTVEDHGYACQPASWAQTHLFLHFFCFTMVVMDRPQTLCGSKHSLRLTSVIKTRLPVGHNWLAR